MIVPSGSPGSRGRRFGVLVGGVILLAMGVTAMVTERFSLRGVTWHGWPALARGFVASLWGVLLLGSSFWSVLTDAALLGVVGLLVLLTAAVFALT